MQKNYILALLFVFLVAPFAYGQAPDAFSYQAVVRDANGAVLSNQTVIMRISIVRGSANGNLIYRETHQTTTNTVGLVNLEIGRGQEDQPSPTPPDWTVFSAIDWGAGSHYIGVEMSTSGTSGFVSLGNNELLSVPYALHAKNVSSSGSADNDPQNEIQDLELIGNDLKITNNPTATQIDLTQYLDNTDAQAITLLGDILTLSNGGTVDLSKYDDQARVTLLGAAISSRIRNDSTLLAGHIDDDNDTSATNELVTTIQMLGDSIMLSEAGQTYYVDLNQFEESKAIIDTSVAIRSYFNGLIASLNSRILNDSIRLNPIEDAAYKDTSNTNELLNSVSLSGNNLLLSDAGNSYSIDLSTLNDSLQIVDSIADIRSALVPLEAGAYKDSSNTNELLISGTLSGNTLQLVDNGGTTTIDLSALNNSSQIIDSIADVRTAISVLNNGAYKDSSSTNELITSGTLSGNNLEIVDNGGTTTIDLSALNNSSQIIDSIADVRTALSTLNNGAYKDSSSTNELQAISISNDTVYLSNGGFAVLPAPAPNLDNDSTNELLTSGTLSGNNLELVDNGGTTTIDLSALNNSSQIIDSIADVRSAIDTLNNGAYKDSSSTNELQALTMSNDTIYLSNGGFVVLPANAVNLDNDSTNELQAISISNDTVYLSNGGFAILPTPAPNLDNDSTNELLTSGTLSGNNLELVDNGGTTTIDLSALNNSSQIIDSIADVRSAIDTLNIGAYKDSSSTNELQALTMSNDTIYLSNGGFVVLPANAVNLDNDSTNEYLDSLYLLDDSTIVVSQANGSFMDTVTINGLGGQSLSQTLNLGKDAANDSIFNLDVIGIGTNVPTSNIDVLATTPISVNIRNNINSGADKKGLFSNVSGGLAGKNFGVYGKAGGSTDKNYGVYGEAGGASGIKYAIYGTTTSGSNSWAGYFDQGDVYVNDTLKANEVKVNGAYTLPDYDGDDDWVLTTDGAGNVNWEPQIGGPWDMNGLDTIYTDKKVGLGTDEPLHLLEIHSSNDSVGAYIVLDSVTSNSDPSGFMVDMDGTDGTFNNNNTAGSFYTYGNGNNNVGIYSSAEDGANTNIGIVGSGDAGNITTTISATGVYGTANGIGDVTGVYGEATNGDNNYGVYGKATGGTNNWAGYFDSGNVRIKNTLILAEGLATPIGIEGPASVSTGYTLTLPNVAPSANQLLVSDATGALSWTNSSSSDTSLFLTNSGRTTSLFADNDTMRFTLNGSEKITIDHEGRVGFNMKNPIARLCLWDTITNATNDVGISSRLYSNSVDSAFGYKAYVYGDATNKYGVYSVVSGVSPRYYATYSKAEGNGLSSDYYGAYNIAEGNGGGAEYYATYSSATGGSGNDNYGLYATASGGTINWAGYFDAGDVRISNSLILAENGGNSIGIKGPGTVTSGYTLTLPSVSPSANQMLVSDGVGVLSWQTVPKTIWTANASTIWQDVPKNVQFGSGNAVSRIQVDSVFHLDHFLAGPTPVSYFGHNVHWNGSSAVRTVDGPGSLIAMTNKIELGVFKTGAASSNANSADMSVEIDTLGLRLKKSGSITYENSSSQQVELKMPTSLTSSYELILPSDSAANTSQVLGTTGGGQLTWVDLTPGCPVGMANAGSYCIDQNERTASNWFLADSTCTAEGYVLSSYSEWYGATATLSLTDETDDWEWVSNMSGNNMMVVGNSGVGTPGIRQRATRDPELTTAPFRCVMRK